MENQFVKIIYSTCEDEHGNKGCEPMQSLTLDAYMKGYKKRDNCFTLIVDVDKADKTVDEIVADGCVIVEQQHMWA
jgi:hypothetical protein